MDEMTAAACQQIRTMMMLQDRMNRVVNEDWIERRRPWFRPAWIEAGEMMNHLKVWKWWGTPHPDYEQAELEGVDILHFVLAGVIASAGSLEAALASDIVPTLILPAEAKPAAFDDMMEAIEDFARDILVDRSMTPRVVSRFVHMAARIGLSQSRAFRLYIGKNALNVFRQKNGYKTGEYVKIWNGREDNEHLSEIMGWVCLQSPDVFNDVMNGLEERYRSLVGAA